MYYIAVAVIRRLSKMKAEAKRQKSLDNLAELDYVAASDEKTPLVDQEEEYGTILKRNCVRKCVNYTEESFNTY